jgi:hypothetical protein
MLASVNVSTVFDIAKHFVFDNFGIATTIFRLSGIRMHFTSLLEKNCSRISLKSRVSRLRQLNVALILDEDGGGNLPRGFSPK